MSEMRHRTIKNKHRFELLSRTECYELGRALWWAAMEYPHKDDAHGQKTLARWLRLEKEIFDEAYRKCNLAGIASGVRRSMQVRLKAMDECLKSSLTEDDVVMDAKWE